MAVIFLFLKLEENFFFRKCLFLCQVYIRNIKILISAAAAVLGSCQPPQSAVGGKTVADLHEILIRYLDMSEKLKFKI